MDSLTHSDFAPSIERQVLRDLLNDEGFNPANVNGFNNEGLSPLMQACRHGLPEQVQQLLEAGADVNQKNSDGNNALWLACFANNIAIIDLLLAHKVDINNRNAMGSTSLIYASSAGKEDIVEHLLKAGANPYILTQDDFTALDLAATPGTYRLLKIYLTAHTP